jgi:hypothetical protein
MPATFTTTLPDAQAPSLDNGVEDEIQASCPDDTNTGQYRFQIRETTATTWTASAEGFQEATTASDSDTSDTVSVTFTGLEDGERYEVRARTETSDVTGAWSDATAITTIFPGYGNLRVHATTDGSVTLRADDFSDNEAGIRVYRADEISKSPQDDDGFTSFQQVADLDPDTTEYQDTGLDDNRAYQYYWQPYTDDSQATTDTVQASTDVYLQPDGWTTVLSDADGDQMALYPKNVTGLDLNREHTAMSDYAIDVPYLGSRIDYWMTATTQVEHYFGGVRIFWGYLEREQGNEEQNTHTLEGRGILRDLTDVEISVQYDNLETWKAIQDVLSYTNFTYNVQQPSGTTTVTDQVFQDPDTTQEFADVWQPPSDVPFEAINDGLQQLPTSFFKEGFEDRSDPPVGEIGTASDSSYSGGTAALLASTGQYVEHEFTPQHDIPEDRVGIQVRFDSSDMPEVSFSFNGNNLGTLGQTSGSFVLSWYRLDNDDLFTGTTYDGGALSANQSYTLRIEVGASSTGEDIRVDCVDLYDTAYPPSFDNTVDGNQALSGPEPYPPAEVESTITDAVANVEQIEVASTWNDTSGQQAIWASNSGGASYEPQGGASNTTSLVEDMESVGTELRMKVRMHGYGTQTESPTQHVNPQRITDWTASYDGSSISVIDSERYTGSVLDVAQKLCKKAGYRLVADHSASQRTVEAFPEGAVEKAADWTVRNRKPSTDLYGYANRVVVYGALQGDGTRPKAVAEDAAEIDAVGETVTDVLRRPKIDTLDGVKSEARAEVRKRVAERSKTGKLEVWPTDIMPGYDYPVDWYGDGSTTSVSLERLSMSQQHANDRATLRFERDRGNDVEIVGARFQRSEIESLL